jgi:manganese/zinc/iron transport system ATP- binding protein
MTEPLFPYGRRRHADPVVAADALEVRDLTVDYPGSDRPAVEGVSLRVPAGTRLALVGPNGAGKSTLLRAVAGLLRPRGGDVRICGNPVGACHHRVAYLPQRGDVDWGFPISVERLVLTGRYMYLGWFRRPGRRDYAVTGEALDRLGLKGLADRQIGKLSGGQQQRALLARALVQGADLLLLDEPLNAVDADTRAVIRDVMKELRQRGKTILCATHDLGRLASDFDSAVYLNEGRQVPAPEDPFSNNHLERKCAWRG